MNHQAATQPGAGMTEALIVALPETAGSALYGMVDVLGAAGNIWQSLVQTEPERNLIRPRIVSPGKKPFTCGNGIPVRPDVSVGDTPKADIIIVPEIWLGPDEPFHGRYPELMAWLRDQHAAGTWVYSACAGAVVLAEAGLLDGREATSHWAYGDLFGACYPAVKFRPEPTLVIGDPDARIVTAGGTTSWHDLAIHIIARHCSPAEAMKVAKIYLLKWHDDGQTPYASLLKASRHADSVVRDCEAWLAENYREPQAVAKVVARARIPERSLKRRFKAASGRSLIEHVQALRIEEAKRLLETSATPVDEISAMVGYEEPGFFRRLFKRLTGLPPSQYRRLFQPILRA